MTTQVSKNLLDTIYVTADGTEPMTGDLQLDSQASPNVILKTNDAVTGFPAIKFEDSTGEQVGVLYHNISAGSIVLARYADTATLQTSLTLTSDGNVAVNGIAPSLDNELTRKDYVDTTTVALDGSRGMTAPLVFTDLLNTSGTIELYQGDVSTGYAIGVEAGATYYRANGNHRWYISTLADAGVSDYMNLSTSGLDVAGLVTATSLNMTTPGADVTTGVTKVCLETGNDGTIRHGTDVAVADFIKNTTSVMANKTLTSPVLNTGVSGTAIDTTVTTSTTKIPHSSAVQAYVAANAGTIQGKNVIINGNFDIWQRGTSFFLPVDGDYLADRFAYTKDSTIAEHLIVPSTSVPTYAQSGTKSTNSLKIDMTTADTTAGFRHSSGISYNVEGYDYAKIAGGDATLSFWVSAPVTGIYNIVFRNSTPDRTFIREYTIASANVWQKVEVTVPLTEIFGGGWNYENGVGLRILWQLMGNTSWTTTADAWQTGDFYATANQVNANASAAYFFFLSQIQLERGDTATDFEVTSYADELQRCQRYYWQGPAAGSATQRYGTNGATNMLAGTKTLNMRATPSATILTIPTYTNCSAANIASDSPESVEMTVTVAPAGPYKIVGGVFEADAEL